MNSVFRRLSSCGLFKYAGIDKRTCSVAVRHLYSDQYLNIDKYVDARELTHRQYGSMKENFMNRMRQQVEGQTAMIFTDDLKTVVHLTDDTPEELDLCTKMIKKFHNQNKELRFGTFVFGPVIMRLFHHLRKPDIVLALMKDEEIQGFFDQIKSYVIAMDLLYEQQRYQDVLDLNEQLRSKQLTDTKFPRDCIVLVGASCYKLNTPESAKYAINLVTEARQAGASLVQKAIYFIASLALNQNKADVAMELLSSLNNNNNVLGNNLKLMTLAKLDRIQDAFTILQKKLERDVPVQSLVRGEICQCALDTLKEAVDKAGDTEYSHEFEQLCRSLSESNSVTVQTIDGLLSTPIVPRPFVEDRPGFGQRRRTPMYGGRDEPAFRRENRIPVRQQAFSSGFE